MSYWQGRQYIGVGPGEVRGQQNISITSMDYMDLFSVRQEHMAGLFSGAEEVLFERPGLRLWSLTCGSVKYSRGDTGHGGGLNWTISSCELLHVQAVVLRMIMTISDCHTRSCHFNQVKCNRYILAKSERMM